MNTSCAIFVTNVDQLYIRARHVPSMHVVGASPIATSVYG